MKLDGMLWDFDAVSLYPSTMWVENSIYPKIETKYAFTMFHYASQDMNDELVENFNNQIFRQASASLKTEYYIPKNKIVQHLPLKGEKKI